MGVNYWLYGDELKGNMEAIDTGQAVIMSMMNQATKIWEKGKVVISTKPQDGGQAIALLGPYGQPYDEGKYYMKIIENLLPDDLEEGE